MTGATAKVTVTVDDDSTDPVEIKGDVRHS